MKYKILIIILMLLVGAKLPSRALSLDTYAENSVLSSGKWVKISVGETGLYLITTSQLKSWGFSDPSSVRIYGYGGARIPDELSAANYVDDLPLVQSEVVDRGIVFYGVGPESWELSSNGAYVNNSNTYSSVGYYFLIQSSESARSISTQGTADNSSTVSTTYPQKVHYEYDRVSPGEAGFLLVGESFTTQSARTFTLSVPGSNSTSEAVMDIGIVSNTTTASTLSITVNGEAQTYNTSDRIPTTTESTYIHATYSVSSHKFTYSGNTLTIKLTANNASSMTDCWLDYIAVTSTKDLTLPSTGYLCFDLSTPSAVLANATTSTVVWDVTDPLNITRLNTGSGSGGCIWTNDYHTARAYAAWNTTASLPSPTYVGTVSNQNIHAMEGANMIIFTLPEYTSQAQRLAELHASSARPISVLVLDVFDVYNEFSSGVPDVSGLRKCAKMFYDRGAAGGNDQSLGYVLLMGRCTYDHRHLTAQFDGSKDYNTIPYYIGGERKNQLNDNVAYGTDDFIAMLGDGSGTNLGIDDLSIAVGRMPFTSTDEAKSGIDKIKQYMQENKKGTWRNHFMFLADDGNSNVHLDETEKMIESLLATENNQAFVSKVYVDAYKIVSGECTGGRNDMYRMLDEGVMWWNFSGHANNHSWTGEKMLTYNDLNNLYLTKIPVLLAATCDFLRWDSSTISGGELLFHERYGGTMATISATRPVYISENGYFTRAVGRAMVKRDANGMLPRMGEIYRMAKNAILDDAGNHKNSTNRLRYVLMGDPALELAMPSNVISLDYIGDEAVDEDAQVTLMALQRTQLKGRVLSPLGEEMPDFNGTINVTLYDAEKSVTTLATNAESEKTTFDTHGDLLFTGSGTVENGQYTIELNMPGEIIDNFRPATLTMMAYSDETGDEAVGVNSDFYVYGLDDAAPSDSISPEIESFVLNYSTFKNGDKVNTSPMAIAQISDDVALNMSTAGIGHQMTLTLDETKTYTDVSLYYTPASDGSTSGAINYPFEDLTTGSHTLKLRVWDTSGNSATSEIYFTCVSDLSPTIYEVYTDSNPASTEANFYIKHDRPDSKMTVTITVYNLIGRQVWSSTVSGPSDMFITSPVTWDLCDMGGRRVPRGIYLYRASITDDGVNYETASRRIAVTAQ